MDSSSPGKAPYIARTPPHAQARLLVFSVLSSALYALNDALQRAFFHSPATAAPSLYDALHDAMHGALGWQFAAFIAVNAALLVAYRGVLALCDGGALEQPGARAFALAAPCLITALLAMSAPTLSLDVFSYMAHGVLGLETGGNPLLQPASDAAHTALGPQLAGFGWHGEIGISPYGILWTRFEVFAVRVSGGDLAKALILLKAAVAAASLGTAYLLWTILGRTRPEARLFGTLAYLWNPVILVELAGEGHNDAVMMFFATAALAACVARRPAASLVMQALGILSKYVSVLFLPLQLAYLWRTRRSARHWVLAILTAFLIACAIAALLYRPLWAGMHTLDGLLQRGQPISSASPFGGLNWLLRRSPWAARAGPLTVWLTALPLLAWILYLSLRVADARGLVRSFAWVSLAYLLVAAPDYWPWYACMPIALLLAADPRGMLWFVIVISAAARLCAPLDMLRDRGYLSMIAAKGLLTGLGVTLPLVVLLIRMLLLRRRAGLHPPPPVPA